MYIKVHLLKESGLKVKQRQRWSGLHVVCLQMMALVLIKTTEKLHVRLQENKLGILIMHSNTRNIKACPLSAANPSELS